MFKIISKSRNYEAMLTQIEGLKSINDRLFSEKNKLINEYRMLEKGLIQIKQYFNTWRICMVY